MRLPRAFVLAIVTALAASLLSACGGGSVAQTPSAVPVNTTLTVGQSASNTTLIDPSGYVATFSLPATSDGSTGTVKVSISTTLPAGIAAPAATVRAPQAIGTSVAPLVYVTLLPSSTVRFNATPAFSFTLPGGTLLTTGSSAYVAYYDPAKSDTGWVPVLGPGTVSGQTIAFPATTGAVKLTAGSQYTFALFTSAQAISVNALGAPLSATPAALVFTGLGTSFTKTLTLTESSGSAAPAIGSYVFTPASCPGTSFSYTPSTGPGSASTTISIFQVVMVSAPSCVLTLTDQFGNATHVALTTATPPTLSASPATVTLNGVGTSYAATITASESNGSLVVLQSIGFAPACPGFAFTNGAAAANLAIQVYAAQPILGSCTLVLTDTSNNTAKVTVTLPSVNNISVGGS
jgi:hypothetical protein